MSLCQSIDTLAMAYLDDELVTEERRELELHLLSCSACKQHVDGERADLALVRTALAAPVAPPRLRVSIQELLDAEDRAAVRAARNRRTRFVLPGAAAVAAMAAIGVFVVGMPSEPGPNPGTQVAEEAAQLGRRQLPYDAVGKATSGWLRQNINLDAPRFEADAIELLGARLITISRRDAALLKYRVTLQGAPHLLTAVMIDNLRPNELSGGRPVKIGDDQLMYVHYVRGTPALTYVDESGPARVGYVFSAEGLDVQDLMGVVMTWDLIARLQQGR